MKFFRASFIIFFMPTASFCGAVDDTLEVIPRASCLWGNVKNYPHDVTALFDPEGMIYAQVTSYTALASEKTPKKNSPKDVIAGLTSSIDKMTLVLWEPRFSVGHKDKFGSFIIDKVMFEVAFRMPEKENEGSTFQEERLLVVKKYLSPDAGKILESLKVERDKKSGSFLL
ncbi:hypothetical protein OAN22_02355 [Alphaproteobacteria bacterium]|nr:hypothetical protein [Alphaproteobacteria bacterium]